MPQTGGASPRPILKQHDSSQASQGPEECASPSSYLGMSYAVSPRSTPKSVSIAPHTEVISPLILCKQKSVDEYPLDQDSTPRKPAVKSPSVHRLSGRLPSTSSPLYSRPLVDGTSGADQTDSPQPYANDQVDRLADQVSNWIKEERAKRSRLESERKVDADAKELPAGRPSGDDLPDLDKLEDILTQSMSFARPPSRKSSAGLRHRSSIKRLQRKPSSISSDTDYFDNEFHVPSSDAALDNSKTLAYTGGASDESDVSSGDELSPVASYRDHDAWSKFKLEIVRLTHTLRLKGWRKVPMDMSGHITVQRLSGALTNAVYVVSPPSALPPKEERNASGSLVPKQRKPPPKLLLRLYGPQVEHLIDREAELAILRRLARKRIGPRLLGTFANGRFEEFFHATTLTAEDLRNPDTSRQIAKRMRELHEGIELLDQERQDGPFVWRNWDKWVQRVEQVVTWLDAQVASLPSGVKPTGPDSWKRRGLICGVPWRQFREAVERYRAWLDDQYGGSKNISEKMVFAHNDTQYGNILRLTPPGESPLLLPANSHKQLVVIDFEYANANLPGLEFANHFTEWCYNYHDTRKPYACQTDRYPTPEEQERFVRAYIRHRPQYNVSTPKLGPEASPAGSSTPGEYFGKRPTSYISDFILDARNPYGQSAVTAQTYDEAAEKVTEDVEVKRLLHETRLWRLANTAQWVAWGIVQAKVPGMPIFSPAPPKLEDEGREDLGERAEEYRELASEQSGEQSRPEEEEEQEEFDYLGYAQHRAMWFWGDALQMGVARPHELPEELMTKVKTVPY